MSRPSFISFLCALCALCGSIQAKRPNVILIVTDDQGYGDMSCHGNPWLKTPYLDRMRDEGVRLEDYHVDPVCTPTRAALMTGRYSLRVGAWAVTEGRQLLNPDETTMAQVFAASGYRTAMFGKWHLGDTYPYAPRFRGFQDVVKHMAGGIDEIGNPKGNNYFDDTLYRNGKPEKFKGYCTDVFFDETIRFAEEHKERSFFVYLPLNAMHSPFTAPEKYWRRFAGDHSEKRAKFFGMIENFDENLGRLFTALEETGLERNTIVIFMGDNGTAAGVNPRDPKDGFNAGMRANKGSVYEGGHRVACFVRWTAGLKAGVDVDQLTSNHDWLPTLIDLCGLKTPEGVQFDGKSIAPLLRNQPTGWRERMVFIDRQGDRPVAGKREGPRRGFRYPQYAVLTERWRMVNGELYDIVADPGQRENIAQRHPQVIEKLYRAYREHFADVTSHGAKNAPFYLGSEQAPETILTVRDWRPTVGRVIWKKEQLSDDSKSINGFWAVDVRAAGRYRFVLSRHPHDDLKPIRAKKARLRLGDLERVRALQPSDKQAVFEIDLTPGPAELQTWFTDAETGQERGAYYVTVSVRAQ